MIALDILLGIIAAWSGASYFVLCQSNMKKVYAGLDATTSSRAAGMALIALILALGFLGLLLK